MHDLLESHGHLDKTTKDITHFGLQWKIQTITKITTTWQTKMFMPLFQNKLFFRLHPHLNQSRPFFIYSFYTCYILN
uniref:Uncharacterized protein n=1 Tax=Oryza brachyantha TaxID=4533 RepID=J3MJ40_ORYBR